MSDARAATSGDYPPELSEQARSTALHVATVLGDLADDLVVVGGIVPYLIIDPPMDGADRHVGTRDLDIGLSLAVLTEERYHELARRLRSAGFRAGRNSKGNLTRQTWVFADSPISIDFLIPPAHASQKPASIQSLEQDLGAIVIPALPLAFMDSILVEVEGVTLKEERAKRAIRVAGPASFVALKAHAFRNRGLAKDAYDLVHVLLHFGDEPVAPVARRWAAIRDEPEARAALAILAEDFADPRHVGPRRRAEFLSRGMDEADAADAHGAVSELLRLVGAP